MCTGSLKGGKATIATSQHYEVIKGFKYAIEIEAVKIIYSEYIYIITYIYI